jgi:O-antigen/teichoic acid export membrane protein
MSIAPVPRQSIISLVSTITLTVIGFLATFYYAHALGPAPLGAYYVFLAYFGIFNLIGDGGFGGAAIKRVSEGKDQNEYFSAFVFLRVMLIAVTVLALIVAEPFLQDLSGSGMFLWLLAALMVSVFASCASMGVYGAGKVGVYQISTIADTVFRVLFQVCAVFLGYSAAGLAGGFVAGMVAGFVINFHYLDLRLVRFRKNHVASLFGFSFWIFLTTSGSLVFNYADTLLISFYLGNADVGIYRTAFQLTSVATFTTLALHTVLYPKMSNWDAEGKRTAIETSLARAFTYSLVLAIPVCTGGWIFGGHLLYYLYGASFVAGTQALDFLLLVQIANVFMYLGTMSLTALNRPRQAFWVTAVASIANIVLNILLIPVLGITGAAVATLCTMTLNAAVALYFLSKLITVRLEHNPVKHILLASIIMGLLMVALYILYPPQSVFVLFGMIAAGAAVYFFVLLKIDREIRGEILEIAQNLGIPWPYLL